MLLSIYLKNFALVDSATISFKKGLNILTGETGAGKTLLIQALSLLSGKKAESGVLRQGQEKAILEALFDCTHLPSLFPLLDEGGIEFDPKEHLIIKREILASSKNRAFINSQMVPLSFLSKIGNHLFELVGQNSAHALRLPETQREILDTFALLQKKVQTFKQSYRKEKDLLKKLNTLESEFDIAKIKLPRLQEEYKELKDFDFKTGEGEALFEEYSKLSSIEELKEKLQGIVEGISHPTATLIQCQKELGKLPSSNSTIEENSLLLETTIVNLQEISYALTHLIDPSINESTRLQEVEKRLNQLNHIKKKYHVEEGSLPNHLKILEEQMKHFETLDLAFSEIKKALNTKQNENEHLARILTDERTRYKKPLEAHLVQELKALNMSAPQVEIQIEPKSMSEDGSDLVSFHVSMNKGESLSPLQSKSSGGEISRFLLALKLILAVKEEIPTLIFDEIDSNIGGETARIISEKLKKLGKLRQILSVTHFPQVASLADNHLQVSKYEKENRTFTSIKSLEKDEKESEILRMLGGVSSLELIER